MYKSSCSALLSILLIGGVLAGACNPEVRKLKGRDDEAEAAGGGHQVSSGGDDGRAGEPAAGSANGGSGGSSSSAGTGAGGTGVNAGTAGVGVMVPSVVSAGCGKLVAGADPDFTLPPNYDAMKAYPVQLGCAEGTPDTVCLATCEALERLREEVCVNLDPVAGCP